MSYYQGMLFRYITHGMWVAICGKALAGYKMPHKKVIAPTVRSFTTDDTTAELFELFAATLFRGVPLSFLEKDGPIVEFRNGMIAAFLKDLPAFKSAVPANDPVLAHVMKCARDCEIRYETLVRWGEAVKVQWTAENAAEQVGDDVNEEIKATIATMSANVVSISRSLSEVSEQSARNKAHNKSVAAQNNRIEARQIEIVNLLKQ